MSDEGSLGVLSALVNRSISQSETARAELAALSGQCLRVKVEGIGITVYLVAGNDRLLLTRDTDLSPQATISGLPLSLVRLLGETAPDATTLRTLGVRLDGDQGVAADFAKLLRRARPDLEEELSLVVGDIAAHQVGSTLRALQGFTERTLHTLRQNTSEFLVEESRMVPNQLRARAFCNEVDQVRDAVERAAARLTRLEQRHKAGEN
jgi:ubiquinone biosynthesis protein UbiJ